MALQHAKLGASSAARWIGCPGSVRLIDSLPESEQRRSSVYADEGTAAHHVAEMAVLKRVVPKPLKGSFVSANGAIIDKGDVNGLPGDWFEIDDEMIEAVETYLGEIDYQLERLGRETCEVYVEVLAKPVPGRDDLFGTADCVIVEPGGELVVVDFKYGKGVVVEPAYNEQCMYYALGAVHEAGGPDDVDGVTIAVVQPRAPHSDGPVRRWQTDTDELVRFGETLVAAAARTQDPNAPRVPGDHCRFCPAASVCPELSAQVYESVVEVLPDTVDEPDEAPTVRLPNPRDPQELAKALQVANLAEYWAKEVYTMAQAAMDGGTEVPGYKLVRGRSHRRWTLEETELVKKLRNKGLKNEDIFSRKVRSPAQIEKKVDKAWVKKYAEKPEGKVTIAPVDDPREAVRPSIAAFANEEE